MAFTGGNAVRCQQLSVSTDPGPPTPSGVGAIAARGAIVSGRCRTVCLYCRVGNGKRRKSPQTYAPHGGLLIQPQRGVPGADAGMAVAIRQRLVLQPGCYAETTRRRFKEVEACEPIDANAMALATASPDGAQGGSCIRRSRGWTLPARRAPSAAPCAPRACNTVLLANPRGVLLFH